MKHQQVIDALKTLITNIRMIDGYLTNIGDATIRDWDVLNVDTADMPYINIRDVGDKQTIETVSSVSHSLTVKADIFAYGDNSPLYVRQVYNDIMKVLGTDSTLSGLVFNIQPTGCDIMAHQSVDKVMIISIGLVIDYNTNYWET